MLRLEPRSQASRAAALAAPFLALALTGLAAGLLLAALGRPPLQALATIFLGPLSSLQGIAELLVKASPLVLIGTGLALAFRAGVWNLGAEGQYTMGALAAGALAMVAWPGGGWALLPLMALAGTLAGAAYGMLPALLKTRCGVSEVLASLMLGYVAVLLLGVLLDGPLRDPEGFNFPQSRLFQPAARLPLLIAGTRAHAGIAVAVFVAAAGKLFLARHIGGFRLRVAGVAPEAAVFGGFSAEVTTWLAFAVSGGFAGLAGVFEAAGPVGQLVPQLPTAYGFSAIIVALLARLDPLAVLPAGLLLALTYSAGEAAQIAYGLPSSVGVLLQGLLLAFLLGADVLITHRLVWRPAERAAAWS